jgi:hypothetical protein
MAIVVSPSPEQKKIPLAIEPAKRCEIRIASEHRAHSPEYAIGVLRV